MLTPLKPTFRVVLRIKADDPDAPLKHGMKFGCSVPVGKTLLDTVKRMDLNIIGIRY